MKYKVIWSDGNAAASRGRAPDEEVNTTIECDPKDIWAVLYMMNYIGWLSDINGGFEDPSFKAEILDYFGVDSYDDAADEDGERMIEIFKSTKNDFEDVNLDGIDGGDPWVLRIEDASGNVLYECDNNNEELDYDDAYDYLKYVLRIPSEGAKQILDDLDKYTYLALEAAASNLDDREQYIDDATDELTESLQSPGENKSTELTEEEVKKYLIDNGFPESSAQYVASLSQTDSPDRYFRNPAVLKRFVQRADPRADSRALRRSMIIFKLSDHI
jgi:hypothetical protein